MSSSLEDSIERRKREREEKRRRHEEEMAALEAQMKSGMSPRREGPGPVVSPRGAAVGAGDFCVLCGQEIEVGEQDFAGVFFCFSSFSSFLFLPFFLPLDRRVCGWPASGCS